MKYLKKMNELNQNRKLTDKEIESIINEIGFVKSTSIELNSKDYQPFITDDEGQVWTINKEHLLDYLRNI